MPQPTVRTPAAVTLATAVLDLVVLVLFHVVQPEVDVLRSATSSYVHGTLGFLSPVAMVAVGIGALALALAAWRVTSGARSRTGIAFLVMFGLAKIVQAFFPIDAEGTSSSTGDLHRLLGILAFFTLPFAIVLLTPLLAPAGTSRGAVLAVTWLPVLATVLVIAGDSLGVFGLLQRVYLVLAALWAAVVARWLLRAGPATA